MVTLHFADGSLATISYASNGHPRTEKERIDCTQGGHSATIVDFHQVEVDGRQVQLRKPDKGHVAQVEAFRQALGGTERPEWPITSTRITLEAAGTLVRQVE